MTNEDYVKGVKRIKQRLNSFRQDSQQESLSLLQKASKIFSELKKKYIK